MELLKHLISFERLTLRTHQLNLLSLESEEDRKRYIEHLVKDRGQEYALDLIRLLKISVQVERDTYEMSPEVFEQVYMQKVEQEEAQGVPAPSNLSSDEDVTAVMGLQNMIERKKQTEAKLKRLQPAA